MSSHPRISVCMIVKNEEAMLPRALASIQGWTDELIVVDTGSTDRTVEIAQSFGARVYHHPWQNNFSLHRNQSLDYSTGDWVLVLDADEEVEAAGVPLIRRVVDEDLADQVLLPVWSVAKSGHHESQHHSLRLFKKSLNLRFYGAVHNELDADSERGMYLPAKILHYGYDLSREKMVAKFHRTTGILKEQMEKDPENPKFPHYLSVSYYTESMYQDALDMALRSKRLCGDDTAKRLRWIDNYYLIAVCHFNMGRFQEAWNECDEALAFNPDYLDMWTILTSLAFMHENSEVLKQSSKKYLELWEAYQATPLRFSTIPLNTLHHRPIVLLRLGLDAYREGDEATFRAFYDQALSASKFPSEVVLAASQFLAGTDRRREGLQLLESALRKWPADLAMVEQRVRLLADEKAFSEAKAVVQNARNAGLAETHAHFFDGLIEMLSGVASQAAEAFKKAVEMDPKFWTAWLNLGLSMEMLGRFEDAEEAYLMVTEHAPDPIEGALNLGNLYARIGRQADAIAFLERVSDANESLVGVHLQLARLYWDTDNADGLFFRARKLGRLFNLSKSDQAESAADLGFIFLQVGDNLLVSQQPRHAVTAFELARFLMPTLADPPTRQGQAYLARREFTLAVNAFEHALRLDPKQKEAFLGMAEAYDHLGAPEAAVLCRQKAYELTSSTS